MTGTRIRRAYSYTEYIYTVCSHGDEFLHQHYSFTEYVNAVCGRGLRTRRIRAPGRIYFYAVLFIYAVCSHGDVRVFSRRGYVYALRDTSCIFMKARIYRLHSCSGYVYTGCGQKGLLYPDIIKYLHTMGCYGSPGIFHFGIFMRRV